MCISFSSYTLPFLVFVSICTPLPRHWLFPLRLRHNVIASINLFSLKQEMCNKWMMMMMIVDCLVGRSVGWSVAWIELMMMIVRLGQQRWYSVMVVYKVKYVGVWIGVVSERELALESGCGCNACGISYRIVFYAYDDRKRMKIEFRFSLTICKANFVSFYFFINVSFFWWEKGKIFVVCFVCGVLSFRSFIIHIMMMQYMRIL